ncbi:MAG TPA: S8 family serine peptidase [Bryobacteraceae bacterium]|nr:S8 family serine peptidase [Bryobacteraceae bacterium]
MRSYVRNGFYFLILSVVLPLAQPRMRPQEYALILRDPALARQVGSRQALATADARNRLRTIHQAQDSLRRELARRKITVTGAVDTLLNAVFVRIPPERAAELAALPGVARVVYMPPLRRHLDQAVNLVNAPAAWNLLGGTGAAGAGVKIGVLDTGIDQNHPAFQDSSLTPPAGFPKGRQQDLAYTNNKIIVARSYVATLSDSDPNYSTPDDTSPRDRSGHGTAVAMVAAGAQAAGPIATITGIAPKAWLGNYKVFGTPGVNGDRTTGAAVQQALQDAFNDGMDIVVLPFGAVPTYGYLAKDCGQNGTDICNPEDYTLETAVANAVSQGMAVVVSAGNDGDSGSQFPTLNTISTPGITPTAITVGSATNAHVFFNTVSVAGASVPANLQNINAVFGDGPKPASALTAPLADVTQAQNDGYACSALPSGALSGKIALIQRGNCSFSIKINYAQQAGAVGVILYQLAGLDSVFRQLGAGNTGIPAVMIGNTDGVALKNYLQSNPGISVTLNPALRAMSASPATMSDFSSRGPTIGDSSIKPDLVAIGAELYTATERSDPGGDLWDPSGFTGASGSSFAAPMVAGAAALVKQRNSGFTPLQLKSAVVNTATTDVTDGSGQARVTAVGAGKLNVGAAVAVGGTVDPATLSFGVLTQGALPINRTLKITNTSSAAATFSLAVARRDSDSNTQLTVSPSSLSVSPGQQGTATVTLQGSTPNPGSYEGTITIGGGGGTSLRVPYLYLVGDGVPFNIFPIINGSFIGVVNDQNWLVGFKLVDQYGVPVTNQPVQFNAASGGGSVGGSDATTDKLGIAAANVNLGPQVGDQTFTAQAGGLTVEFDAYARQLPTIGSGGVVNAASGQVGQGLAPGSYISIYGSALSDATQALSTSSLPLAMAGVSVSFDAPGLSLPGRLSFVSPGQVNVQVPWELQGLSSAQMKVSIDGIPSAIYSIPLSDYAPAAFEYNDTGSGRQLAAVLDENYALVTVAHPAVRGQVIQVYANGLGPVNNRPASGEPSPAQPLATTRVTPTVTIGGQAAQVQFSGLVPPYVGLYQINVTVPQGVSSGIQPLVISANGVASKTSNLPVQ